MSKAYIMHGFIGAGKTTFAKKLEKETGAKRFTPDEIIAERYGRNLTTVEEIREANIAVKKEIWEEIQRLISEDKDVILDYGLWKKEPRDNTVNDVEGLGATAIIYEILCDTPLMRERALTRDVEGNNKMTAEMYDTYYKRLEPMKEDEERVTVWTSLIENKTDQLVLIGGHLLCDEIEDVKIKRYYSLLTPFGETSAPIVEAEVNGKTFFYLKRHGANHELLPHEINNKANVYALKMLGVTRAIGISAASIESLKDDLEVGGMFVPSQYFDWTKNNEDSFFGDGLIAHIATTNPCCPSLTQEICKAAGNVGIDVDTNRTLACIKGPRFLTNAENAFLSSAGCDAVGMSCISEACLAREAQISYATIAFVSDKANDRGTNSSHETLQGSDDFYDFNIWKDNLKKATSVVKEIICGEKIEAPAYIRSSLLNVVKTPVERRTERHKEILSVLEA